MLSIIERLYNNGRLLNTYIFYYLQFMKTKIIQTLTVYKSLDLTLLLKYINIFFIWKIYEKIKSANLHVDM